MLVDSGNQKIRIFSKKLPSGNYQVKFFVNSNKGRPYYGYILVESGRKVSEVFSIIYQKLQGIDHPDRYFHDHLLKIGNKKYHGSNFLLFRDKITKFNSNPEDTKNEKQESN